MDFNEKAADILSETIEKIEKDKYSEAVAALNGLIKLEPDRVDARMISEVKLVEKLIAYKKELADWDYLSFTKKVYEYCEKRYAKDLKAPVSTAELPDRNVIWCCWLQGIEQAPEVVKACVRSLEKFGREIRIITSENYADYVKLPQYIIRKWEEGIISNTHFSDLLRIELLAERGGLWIDATVYCSDPTEMKEVLEDIDLFAYSFAIRGEMAKFIMFDSWFLYAAVKNPIIEEIRQMLWDYWKNEDYLMHYFLFHICFSICCRRHEEEYRKIPVYSMEPCHILQQEMLESYSEKRWNQIMKMSGIHKITYKYDQTINIKNTMLEHLIGAIIT